MNATAPADDKNAEADEPTAETGSVEEPPSTEAVVIFEIVQAESSASFTIDEILGGQPNTVVGTTD